MTLTGSNILTLRHRLNELVNKFVSDYGDLAIEKIDASDNDFDTILDSVLSLPFLAAKKMIVIREPGINKEVAENIEQLISSVGESTELILYEPEPDKRTAYYKALQRHTKIEQFSELDTPGLASWLVEEASALGGQISLPDANYLVERVGANQQLLASELEKLFLYDKKISRASIDLLTESTPQGRVFDLLDAAFGGHKEKALKLYGEQRAQKVEPQAIMAMLVWQLNLITLAKLGRDRSPAVIASDAGIKPYPVTKASGLAAKLGNGQLRRMISELLNIDVQSKTTSLDLDEALKTYIVTL